MDHAEMQVEMVPGRLQILMSMLQFLILGQYIQCILMCPTDCTCSSESGTVTCTNKDLKEIPKDIPADTYVLHLEFNKITNIPDGAFKDLHWLRELYLSNNLIETISPGAFQDISDDLKLLDLSNNRLRRVDLQVFGKMRAKTRLYHNPWHCECLLQELIVSLQLDPETVNEIICDTSVQEEYAGKPFIQLLNSGINFCSMQQKTTDVAMLVTMFCWFTMVITYVVYYVRQNQEDARRHLEYLKSLPSKQKTPGDADTVSTVL
ncbi:leucine-rich repeat-containing protein 3-like [Protopterus annectens]|uniref:leucine-rich repeat-containing protein 3-like n=1 Tax=Protopterus annectens TaxID=7888 RepID=UPI001CFA4EE5|nr:leucine-rich repeat-containing protein 3-like [Protopterus annectens]XP_043939832.1 leucine-rich repeat-containing protein 3-like [Protopterus annectens]XP_043939833.1 leucine-rich repeat-containing protein 3-like [Protopterus annectens]XP_043939834.1 leucine-rich repeat-containing protein 3-like [Protopterus annectens]XP_043939835.1 leucine-rich repeat-containing protein 3-like [Protopterus annectens]XP_043939836.1 leucine-rich repeat-containing protein 3-like [Protopterus annectens]XP_04